MADLVEVVLAHPLEASAAVELGLQNREYVVTESVLVSAMDAVRLIRYGLAVTPGFVVVTPPPPGGGGGGGGGGGQVIVTPITVYYNGQALPVRGKLTFAGAGVTVADDPVNGTTLITIAGAAAGGGGGGGGTPSPDGLDYPGATTFPGTDVFPD